MGGAVLTTIAPPTQTDTGTPAPSGANHSASEILDHRQRQVLTTACLFLVACLLIAPLPTVIGIMAITTGVYLAVVCERLLITKRSLDGQEVLRVSDDEARAVPDESLPIYTVLVPAYKEAQVIEALAAHLRALDYPRDRLDLKLLLEADDYETIHAARLAAPDIQIVLVPPAEPRTKPKALNCGLESAHGDLVTIYDAEDIPDPLQLRRAVVAFQRVGPEVACLQAQLTFHNWNRNIITRWFTIEYLMWFTLFLPGLSSMDAPVPLGGTSNHIRRDVLESIGSWDPYNVTEDADLGVRLHAEGWRTAVLESETLEEPNSDFVNWVKQRSRWYKGYLQTWLVNLRRPIELCRSVGPGGFAQFNLFVGGTPVLSILNPFFWLLTLIWFTGHASIIEQIFPAPLYHLALFSWIVGNLAVLYVTILAARRSGRTPLVWAACLVPVYWVMMSMAAIKALWQVLAAPSFWEKTTHGLATEDAPPAPVPAVVPAAAFTAFPTRPLAWSTAGSASIDRETGTTSVGVTARNGDGSSSGAAVGSNGNGSGTRSTLAETRPALALPITTAEPGRARRIPWATLGRGLRTVGLVTVLFVGFLVLWTGWRASAAQSTLRHQRSVAPARAPRTGSAVARLDAPAAGVDVVVVEGSGSSELNRGPGHVPGSAYPGGPGNVVVIGHRVVAGAPFSHLDHLHRGNEINFVTPWGRAQYRVDDAAILPTGSIDLSNRGAPRLTLVTSATGLDLSQRLVVTAHLRSGPLPGTPRPPRGPAHLPGPDRSALPLLVVAVLAGLLAWYARRWLMPAWGRLRAAMVVAPFVVIALCEAFLLAVRVLPATF